MPEPRFDPLGRRWVLLAPERAKRPGSSNQKDGPPTDLAARDPAPCDFCAGHEDSTPPETLRFPEQGAPWRVRVFPNRYPAAAFHEVIVHSPGHDHRIELLDPEHRLDVLRAYRARSASAAARCTLAVFNRGHDAGATRAHEHSQLFGLDIVPPVVSRECEAMSAAPCVVCEMSRSSETLVGRHGPVSYIAHPTPLVPHELLVIPRCAPRLQDAHDDELLAFGDALADCLRRLPFTVGGGAASNVVVHTAPAGVGVFHWHAHVYPRVGTWGGLEVGAELPIVSVDPGESARLYRDG